MGNYISYLERLKGRSLLEDVRSSDGVLLIAKGCILSDSHIKLLRKFNLQDKIRTGSAIDLLDGDFERSMEASITYMNEIFHLAALGKLPSLNEFRETFAPLMKKIVYRLNVTQNMYSLKKHDTYTYAHSVNVGFLSGFIGRILNLSPENVSLLCEVGLLHDIGKSKIDKNLLNKCDTLEIEELEEIRLHTYYGYNLLTEMVGNNTQIINGALLHHERLDGSGYPLKIQHDNIPWYVQILMVADIYDAMVTRRAYKEKRTPFYALNELRVEMFNKKINPKIVIPFFAYLLRQYIHSYVVLSDMSYGEVVFIFNDQPERPLVRIEKQIIDLRKHPELSIIEVKPFL
jgi:HD-GYP domain-containing protein (c-di-GMP phosphodiesterase class II)